MSAIGRHDLAADTTLATNAGRDLRAAEIYAVIGQWVATHSELEVLQVAEAAEVPASRIFSVTDMFENPQFAAREMLEAAMLPDGKPFRIPGILPRQGAPNGSGRASGSTTRKSCVGLAIKMTTSHDCGKIRSSS